MCDTERAFVCTLHFFSDSSIPTAADGDEASAPGVPVDTNGVQGADEVAPADSTVEEDPNGARLSLAFQLTQQLAWRVCEPLCSDVLKSVTVLSPPGT